GGERGRRGDRVVREQVAAGGIVRKAGRRKIGMRDGGCGMRDSTCSYASRIPHLASRQDNVIAPQQPLLFQEFARQCPPVAHVSACSTASRIRSATSRLSSSGSSIGVPLFPMIVTRFVVTSNPAPGSSALFRMM